MPLYGPATATVPPGTRCARLRTARDVQPLRRRRPDRRSRGRSRGTRPCSRMLDVHGQRRRRSTGRQAPRRYRGRGRRSATGISIVAAARRSTRRPRCHAARARPGRRATARRPRSRAPSGGPARRRRARPARPQISPATRAAVPSGTIEQHGLDRRRAEARPRSCERVPVRFRLPPARRRSGVASRARRPA